MNSNLKAVLQCLKLCFNLITKKAPNEHEHEHEHGEKGQSSHLSPTPGRPYTSQNGINY